MLNNAESKKLFAKSVPVTIKDVFTQKSRTCKLFLSVEWAEVTDAICKRELIISLTDENDPFFLHNLHLSEEDFQIFLLVLNVSEKIGNAASSSQLEVVETNTFKFLTHLSLKFLAATESAVKQYLTLYFRNLKAEKHQLENRVNFLEKDYKDKLSSCQQALQNKQEEIEIVKKEFTAELAACESKHAKEIIEERDKLLNKLREEEKRFEKEIKEKEHALRKQIQQLETKISYLETLNKELHEKNHKLESTIRDYRSKNQLLEEELKKTKDNLRNFKNQNEHLQAEIKEKSSLICHQKEKIDELEQDLNYKKQSISRLKEHCDIQQQQKVTLETELEMIKSTLEMSEKSQERIKVDIEKSNAIILKLQKEVKFKNDQLQNRDKLLLKQERNIEDKEKNIEKMKKHVTEMKAELEAKNSEVENLSFTVSSLEREISTLKKDVRDKDNVIKYLNRQLTDLLAVPKYTSPANLVSSPSTTDQAIKTTINASKPISCGSPSNISIPSKGKAHSRQDLSVNRTGISSLSPLIGSSGTVKDSAYPSPTSGCIGDVQQMRDLNRNEPKCEIDPAALNAAFGTDKPSLKHSTAKKENNFRTNLRKFKK
ncbi:spindle assembly abnormal protein 6 homolog isoform X2 [Stegodyphus dumicola]|uniref:spindle assembly abnormal protein 6 homolog isoform X2 n=1 Tax=Stegodyphus dumicola TaxID=202533 RepID=UPI0015AFADBF|nr:spindle assembly abnormal protein 6 homolog isoform X2 [Stegodyphus dumicola]